MSDLFTRTEVTFGGAMHAQNGVITPIATEFGPVSVGALLQNINLNYGQQVTRIYELGNAGVGPTGQANKTRVFLVAGRAQGTLAAAHVIGPGVSLYWFYRAFSDVCNARNNTLELDMGPNICPDPTIQGNLGLKYQAKYCVLTAIGMSMAAQDFVVNENSQIMFSGLDFSDWESAMQPDGTPAALPGP